MIYEKIFQKITGQNVYNSLLCEARFGYDTLWILQ